MVNPSQKGREDLGTGSCDWTGRNERQSTLTKIQLDDEKTRVSVCASGSQDSWRPWKPLHLAAYDLQESLLQKSR